MAFHFEYYYPSREKPEFMVATIVGGYKFTFYDNDGKRISDFSISAGIVENRDAATGYDGKEKMAIENFRSFLFRFN